MRLGDVDPDGRARLDALARYLQDIARDDSTATDIENAMGWVVRRTLIEVQRFPRLEEGLELATWCSGYGGRWAERRTGIRGQRGAIVDTATVWVHVDMGTGRPERLPERFFEIWGEASGDRKISARTSLPPNPPPEATERSWTMRAADFDILGHVNNAVHWAAVEEVLTRRDVPARMRAELEHGVGIEPDQEVVLRASPAEGIIESWLMADGVTASAARVTPLPD